MFCPNCGNDCGDANFCSNCGQNLRETSAEKVVLRSVVETNEIYYPEPPIGRYNNHDHDYVEIGSDSITIFRTPLLMRETSRSILFSQIKAVSVIEARKFKNGGFLSIQDCSVGAKLKTSFNEAVNDELSIVFSWKQNDSFLTVYEFLKSYAEKAFKNHQIDKRPSAAQQTVDDVAQARARVNTKNDAPAQNFNFSPNTLDVEELAWYPGKERGERKARIAELEESSQVYCPKCLSTSVSGNKKGFGIGKAVVGAVAFGGIGLMAGNIGAKKVICTCLKCGYQWNAGKK